MYKPIHLIKALGMWRRARRVRKHGVKRYTGSAADICTNIIKDCWNSSFFQASNGHFTDFWLRDFSWCLEPLLRQGYKEECISSMKFALDAYQKNGKVTTTITKRGYCYDFPDYAADSLPYLIRNIRILADKDILYTYEKFLNHEIEKYYAQVIDQRTGLVRKDRNFSSMKDHALRISPCYSNVMAGMLSVDLARIGILNNPFKAHNYRRLIWEHFWNGEYFLDDLSGKKYVAGDANIFPFWSGLFNETPMLKYCITKIREAGLDHPFPLKYTGSASDLKMISAGRFAPNYEGTAVWTHMGPIYIKLVKEVAPLKAREYVEKYSKIIEKYGNYLEVFETNSQPYQTRFYYADEGMLWASMFLDLL
ncbi:hypothetical protein HYV81_05445 [Candidatus Woesearchaeota archaeon]|nr:hypothetical protein [Candidatus Woesearchaeota archaeon]